VATKIKVKVQSVKPLSAENEADANIVELIKALESVDIKSPLAKLNETTISDNNGGRIYL
jgi:hypothetical protein